MIFTAPPGYHGYIVSVLAIAVADCKRNEDRRTHEYVGLRGMAWVPFDAEEKEPVVIAAGTKELIALIESLTAQPAPADAAAQLSTGS
jgi:hypothetical protein